MSRDNSITLAFRFYRKHAALPSFWYVLFIVGISGLLETLPILLSLPLIKSIYEGSELIVLQNIRLPLITYTIILGVVLIIRFALGFYSQYLNASIRITLLSDFREQKSSNDRQNQKLDFGKSVQGLNFLFIGWSQVFPGIIYSTIGTILSPVFGGITLLIVLIWSVCLRMVKSKQDLWSTRVHSAQTTLEEEEHLSLHVDQWKQSKFGAAKWDSINKNLRELIVISTLIISLMISYNLNVLTGMDSLFIVVIFLRGLQQLFTGYIMSQQLSALRSFLKNGIFI